MNTNVINKILVGVVAVLVVVLIIVVLFQQFGVTPSFHAVYLRTGELYFGHLVRFPSFGLKQVYFLQVNAEDQQTPFRVQRFYDVFWGPDDFMKLNRDEVVWISKLRSDSQLLNLLVTNPTLTPIQSPGANVQQPPQVTPPGTEVPAAPAAGQ